MKKMKALLMATTVGVGCLALADAANAQLIFAGGATFPAPTYRYLMDCWGLAVDSDPGTYKDATAGQHLAAYPLNASCPYAAEYNQAAQILYAPVGSGGGKRALKHHNGSRDSSVGLGDPASSNPVPYVSQYFQDWTNNGAANASAGYPTVHFIGSDDVWNSQDATDWATLGNPAKYGNVIQLPSVIGAVTIPFNGTDGTGAALQIANATPNDHWGNPGSSGLNLSRQALCGIFSGKIHQWDNAYLTQLNGGTTLGTGKITVVHRSDGSGTTFLFTNALYSQCAGVYGLGDDDSTHNVSFEFRFSDAVALGNDPTNGKPVCPAIFYRASNQLNWPDIANDQCGNANGAYVSGSNFVGASGNGNVISTIKSTLGSIGYSTTDYTQPIVSSGPANANLQNEYDLDHATGVFVPPTSASAQTGMAAASPNWDLYDIFNPVDWSRQGVVPNPVNQYAYPIVGFTWLDFYQCYAENVYHNELVTYLTFHYADDKAIGIIHSQGFANVPTPWLNSITTLVSDTAHGMNGTDCSGKPGA